MLKPPSWLELVIEEMEQFCYISFVCFAVYIISNVFAMFTETLWVYGYAFNMLYEKMIDYWFGDAS